MKESLKVYIVGKQPLNFPVENRQNEDVHLGLFQATIAIASTIGAVAPRVARGAQRLSPHLTEIVMRSPSKAGLDNDIIGPPCTHCTVLDLSGVVSLTSLLVPLNPPSFY